MSFAPGTGISRRGFLITGSVGGTALVIGLRLGRHYLAQAPGSEKPIVNPLEAWVRIDKHGGITLIVAKDELGQGAYTALPMILAEELDVDLTTVKIEHAVTDPRIYDLGTGGSGSVSDSYLPLRRAGAAARAMLIAAAAEQWNVTADTCRTENGRVLHGHPVRSLGYGELVEAAAKMPIPDLNQLPLKNHADFKIVGTSPQRLDIPAKCDGSAVFGMDVRVPGMLYAVIARCPTFGGKAGKFDASKARSVPGVRKVLEIPAVERGAFAAGGVAVLADSTWAAMQGRNALIIEWDKGPAASESSATLRAQFVSLAAQPGAVIQDKGDARGALRQSPRNIEAVYELPFLAHATMEPMNATVSIGTDSAEAWVPTQAPQWAQSVIATVAKLSPNKVTVHSTYSGGGFGRRYQADFVAEAAQIAQAAGKAVHLVWTREDDMQHDFYRQATYQKLAATLDEQGNPAAWHHRLISTSIREMWGGKPEEQEVGGAEVIPYACPNFRLEYAKPQTRVPRAWWRSVEHSMNGFTVESFVDELAHAAGVDPLAYRLRLMGAGQPPGRAAELPGRNMDPSHTTRLAAVLKLAAEQAGWGRPLAPGRGRGVACHFSFGTYVAMVAEASADKNGVTVQRIVAAIDCNRAIDPDGVRAQAEGAIVYGLSAALYGQITIEGGAAQQTNFDSYPVLRFREMPLVEVYLVPSEADPSGMGEPCVPPVAPAVTNALFAATGKRIRRLPIRAEDLV